MNLPAIDIYDDGQLRRNIGSNSPQCRQSSPPRHSSPFLQPAFPSNCQILNLALILPSSLSTPLVHSPSLWWADRPEHSVVECMCTRKNQGRCKFMLCKSRHGGHEKWINQPWRRVDTLGFVTHRLSSVLGLGLATDIVLKNQCNRQLGYTCFQLTNSH